MKPDHPETRAQMVDVTHKTATEREAVASCNVHMTDSTVAKLREGRLEKGDALEVARIAGIMAAKKTSDLIPLCHPIPIGAVDISFEEVPTGIAIHATVKTTDRTGVEMEALTAVTIAGLTVYDMVKGTERSVEMSEVRLLRKSGGRSGTWHRNDDD